MNVFKNKKNVGKIKKTLKNVKKRALDKKRKNVFYIYATYRPVADPGRALRSCSSRSVRGTY